MNHNITYAIQQIFSPSRTGIAYLAQRYAQTAPTRNSTPAVYIISPKPTKGGTNPPNRKPIAPNRAEAIPAYLRSQSIAKAFDAV
mgnify:CR=1 FL=1